MQLWQLDGTASLFLADGRECKVITGIADQSRFCVIATVVLRATGRAVCSAFVTAMQAYGVPAEVLSDNGKQFTGRFGKPRPAEVLFERSVTGAGNISIGDHIMGAGLPLAAQRVTLRLEGPVAHILADGVLVRTLACPVPEHARPRLRGARAGSASQPQLPKPQKVLRRVSVRGTIMIGGQRIQVGLPHAGKTAEVTVEVSDTFAVRVPADITVIASRNSSREIRRHKAARYPPRPGGAS
jgi:Integrase core domain